MDALTQAQNNGDMNAFIQILRLRSIELAKAIHEVSTGSYSIADKAFYVNGFRPDRHCQPCSKGRRHEAFYTGRARTGQVYELNAMNQYPFVYICGVGIGPDKDCWKQNLHLPLIHVPGQDVSITSYKGYVFTVRNARAIPIPPLPEGWNELDRKMVRCKNFQFAVAQFGYTETH